jgi:tetratricopeptide (TPR) repeat protein
VLPIAPGSEQHAAALITRAQAELNLGDLEEALATLADAEQLYPDQPEARLVRISTLLSEHRQDEARAVIEEARAALAGDEDETVALRHRLDLTLAQIQAQQGDPEAALATLEAMVESNAGDVLAWRALAQVLAQQERAEELLPKLAAALEAEEPPTDLYALVAQLHAALGHEDEAEAALRTFVDRSESPAAFLPLVELHSARGDAEAARAVLDEAPERYPDEATLRLLRTETLLAEEQLDEARAESARFREATFQGDPPSTTWRHDSSSPTVTRAARPTGCASSRPSSTGPPRSSGWAAPWSSPAISKGHVVATASRSSAIPRGPLPRRR